MGKAWVLKTYMKLAVEEIINEKKNNNIKATTPAADYRFLR